MELIQLNKVSEFRNIVEMERPVNPGNNTNANDNQNNDNDKNDNNCNNAIVV